MLFVNIELLFWYFFMHYTCELNLQLDDYSVVIQNSFLQKVVQHQN